MTMTKRVALLLMALILVCTSTVIATEREHDEKWYQTRWCEDRGGLTEVRLPDGTRCDCLTGAYAIEFDFGDHFYQAIGQSLHYAMQAYRQAGIVLILETAEDLRFWLRLKAIILYFDLPINVWMIGPEKRKAWEMR
jgi:hypothetical protein